MMKSIAQSKIIFSLFAVIGLSACLNGKEDQLSTALTASLVEVKTTTYDTSTTKLKVRGVMKLPGTAPSSRVLFYTTDACTDNSFASGSLTDFQSTGVEIQVSSTKSTAIYVGVNTFKGCSFLLNYSPDHSAPQAPVLSSMIPASPSRTSTTPVLIGTSGVFVSQVRFYDDAACAHMIGGGTPTLFATNGVQIQVTTNQKTDIYAVALEPFGNASPCMKVGSFQHSNIGPNPPGFRSTSPISPSKLTTTPIVIGTAPVDALTVKLFSDASCSTEIGAGPSATYTSIGLQVQLQADRTTGIYGMSYDTNGNPSTCAFVTSFVHDTVAPAAPVYSSATPASSTRLTIYPKIKGLASSDTVEVRMFSDAACLVSAGSGTKAVFEGAGITTTVKTNDLTMISAVSVDAAGNTSPCTYFTLYKHNTIPPDPPVYNVTNPISPNNRSTTPLVLGAASATSVTINLFSDSDCTVQIGTGPAGDFTSPGIQATVPSNANTVIYANAVDPEGNISACTSLISYEHSTVPAPAPGFLLANPASPTRLTQSPWIVGTASSIVSTVELYSDNACSASSFLGRGSRSTFTTAGIQIVVNPNTLTPIYGLSYDKFGNNSACTLLTNYIHNTIPPFDPIFSASSPASPNNTSSTPMLTGTITTDPTNILPVSQVKFFDSLLCLSQIGAGTPTDFMTGGIQASLPMNAISPVYAQSSDDAGNKSNCTLMLNYTHINIKPGKPIFGSSTPATPSYTRTTTMLGTFASSTSFMPITNVGIYSDSTCQTLLTSGSPATFLSGMSVTMNRNTTTTVYGTSFDQVGNFSTCNALVDYFHNDLGPTGLASAQNPDGSVGLSWTPDSTASPVPKFVVKRSLRSGGPYTILNPAVSGTSFTDLAISNNTTYYYVVAATNNTGTSLDSSEIMQMVSASTPNAVISLAATPGPQTVTLTWNGDFTDMTFSVMRSTQRGGPYTEIKSKLTSPSYVDTPVTDGTPYYYVIVAKNPAGSSASSNEANAVPQDYPAAPTNLTIRPDNNACNGSSGVVLTWGPSPYRTTYNVYRGRNSGQEGFYASTGSNTFVDCNFSFGGTHYYYVNASWGITNSQNSNEVASYYAWPAGFRAYPGDTDVTLKWTLDPSASSYDIFRATQSGGPYTSLATGVTSNMYDDTTVANGTTYYYKMRNVYGTGIYSWDSGEATAKPSANASPDPSNLSLTVSSSRQPVLEWSMPQLFNQFYIYRASSAGGPYTLIGANDRFTMPLVNQYTDALPLVGLNYYKVSALWGASESTLIGPVAFQSQYPTSLTAANAASSISLTWSSVPGAAGYDIYRSTSSIGPFTSLGSTTAPTVTYTDSTVVAGTGYFYNVRANFATGPSGPESPIASGMTTGTNVPSGLTVTYVTTNSISISWAAVKNATQYKIYKATSAGGPYTLAGTTTTTSGATTSLLSNTRYYVEITAVVGGVESAKSSPVSAYTVTFPSAPSLTPGSGSVLVSCTSASGATYDVQRSTDNVTFSTVATNSPTSAVTDSTPTNGVLYYYRCVANVSGFTMTSPSSTVTPGFTPAIPSGLNVTANTNGTSVGLTFSGVPGATSYTVYVGTSSGSYNVGTFGAASAGAGIVQSTITGLTSGTTYYFAATASNGTVESAKSAETIALTLATPTAPTVKVTAATSVTVTWSSVGNGVTTYDVLRADDNSEFLTIASNIGNITTYTDTAATNGVAYTYQYKPYKGAIPMSTSAASALVTTGTAPLAPANLNVSPLTTTSVQLDWTQVSNITGYNVYRGTTTGGPYTLAGSVSSLVTTYTDSTPSAGQTYYYVVTAENSSGVNSSYSPEVGVKLVAAPGSVAATASPGQIQITWAAVAGAASYQVRRSESASGPFGSIATGVAGTSYNDTSIVQGTRYYYIVNAVFAGGLVSTDSASANAVAQIIMNLQVPIELTDRGLASDTTAITFERTRTSLDTADYDGTVAYAFEAIVLNAESSAYGVQLVDTAGATVATLTVPADTYTPKRIRVAFTPTAGANDYRVKLPATGISDSLVIYSARVFVTQTGATRTKIYVPLSASWQSASHSDVGAYVDSATGSSFTQLQGATPYLRDTANLAYLSSTNPWELEAIVATTSGATGSLALTNTTNGTFISESRSLTNSSSLSLVRSPFMEGVTGFSASNEGHEYEISLRCEYSSCASGGHVDVYKAGLWIKLTALDKVQIPYRLSLGNSPMMTYDDDSERTQIDLTLFSNPTAYFEAAAGVASAGSASIDLMTAGTADLGPSALVPVAGSTLSVNSMSKTRVRSSAITPTSGDRLLPELTISGTPMNVQSTTLVIEAHK